MNLSEVNRILQSQLNRLDTLDNLTNEEVELEMKRSQHINITAGNLIKLGTVAVAAENIKLRYLELDREAPQYLEKGLLNG